MKNKFYDTENINPVKSVQKALGLLDAVIRTDLTGGSASLSDLATLVRMPSNSAHNLLKTLCLCGYVSQPSRGVYKMGPKARQLHRVGLTGAAQTKEAMLDCLKQFAEKYQEACVVVSLINGDRAILAQLDGGQAICVSGATIRSEEFFNKPTGRLLAAMAGPEELSQIIDRHGMPGEQWGGIDDEAALQQALETLRQQRFSIVDGDGFGLAVVAVAVGSNDDIEVGCDYVLGAYAPSYRCDNSRCMEMVETLKSLARPLGDVLYKNKN